MCRAADEIECDGSERKAYECEDDLNDSMRMRRSCEYKIEERRSVGRRRHIGNDMRHGYEREKSQSRDEQDITFQSTPGRESARPKNRPYFFHHVV